MESEQEVSVDYSVKVQIWEGRNIKASDIRPFVKVSLCNIKKATPVKRSAENPFWNEVFLFHVKKSHSVLLSESVHFHLVGSKRIFSRDVHLGGFVLSMGDVYKGDKHSFQKKWLLLTNEFNEFVGYLKVTIAIIGPNESFPPEEILEDFETDIAENVIQPKSVSLYPVELFVKIHEVCHVPR